MFKAHATGGVAVVAGLPARRRDWQRARAERAFRFATSGAPS